MNRLMVTGRVVADPVSVICDDGELTATFTVADAGAGAGDASARCALFHCTAHGRMAIAVDEYLSAGSAVVVDGQLVPVGHPADDVASWLDLRVESISSALFIAPSPSERRSA